MANDLNKQAAQGLVDRVPGAFIGGSFLLDEDTAADIDIVVPAWSYGALTKAKFDYGLLAYTPGDLQEYAQDVEEQYIVQLYRGNGGLNVIVVSELYYLAYVAGRNEYLRNPQFYKGNKELRTFIHKEAKEAIRKMLSGEFFFRMHPQDTGFPYNG